MAALTPWGAVQTRAQYAAIVRLRWRMFINGFRRKGGVGDVIGSILMVPFFLVLLLGTCAFAAFTSWGLVEKNQLEQLHWVFWGIFFVTQMININLGQPGTTFDPTQLIRFPLSMRSYTAIRLFFGVMSPGNILAAMLPLAAALGMVTARPGLWPFALCSALLFALANILFTRMIFTWVDRWLSTRLARQVLGVVAFVVFVGFQYWNITYNVANIGHHRRHHAQSQHSEIAEPYADDSEDADSPSGVNDARIAQMTARYQLVQPYLAALPPGLAGKAIAAGAEHRTGAFAAESLATLGWAGVFLAIFALRMKTEFRGENLSDQANAVTVPKPVVNSAGSAPVAALEPATLAPATMHSTVAAVVGKEILYMRRNMGLLYGLVFPLLMAAFFAARLSARTSSAWIFPGALVYALLGVVPASFNSFGLESTGAQFFFLAPVRLRDVLLAKNLLNLGIALLEVLIIGGLVTYSAGLPPLSLLFSTVLWAVLTVFVSMTVGNYMSIRSPKRIDPGRTAQKQARPLSALLAMGILLVTASLAWAILTLASVVHLDWIAPLVLLLLAAVAGWIYWHNLEGMDLYAMRHRDNLFEELGKKA